jgi:hypothetical protein
MASLAPAFAMPRERCQPQQPAIGLPATSNQEREWNLWEEPNFAEVENINAGNRISTLT